MSEERIIRIEYSDDADQILMKVNRVLVPLGYQFVWVREENDGFDRFMLVDIPQDS